VAKSKKGVSLGRMVLLSRSFFYNKSNSSQIE